MKYILGIGVGERIPRKTKKALKKKFIIKRFNGERNPKYKENIKVWLWKETKFKKYSLDAITYTLEGKL